MNTILNAAYGAGNAFLHALRTDTFCWVAAGLAVAILVTRGIIKKKRGKKQDANYAMEGMSLGMCSGLLIGTLFEGYIGVCISIGMITGLLSACVFPKSGRGRKSETKPIGYPAFALRAFCSSDCL